MSYTSVEAGLIRAITNHADFSCNNTVANDHRSLGDGAAIHAIITFGGFQRQEISIQRVYHIWSFTIDLYTRYEGQIQPTLASAHANRQSLLGILDQYPALADTTGIVTSGVTAIGLMETPNANVPQYYSQPITLTATEVVNPNRLE